MKIEEHTKGTGFFEQISELEHEQILICSDNDTGLKAIIGLHNSVLGPCLGGTRMWSYASDEAAMYDVLRLSRGMTFKASITGLNLGGGKAVIIGDSRTQKSEALMRRFGQFINNLGGKYYTAEDVGTSTMDMQYIGMETDFVTGIPQSMGGSGDPSPVTAYGTYLGMKAALQKKTGSDSLAGKKVIVQGVGNVGHYLCDYLHKENAEIYAFDIYPDKIKAVSDKYKIQVISAEEVYRMKADIYAPCALGATVNKRTIPTMNVSIIAGAANNQLEDEVGDAKLLKEKGILFAPDFVINAGGLINVYGEIAGYNEERAMEKADEIYNTTLRVFDYASEKNLTTSEAAIELAKARLREIGNIRKYI